LPSSRFLKLVLRYLAICSGLAASLAAGSAEETAPNAASGWLETLYDLPMIHWLVPAQPIVPAFNHWTAAAPCGVAPLPAIADSDALAFEERTSPDTRSLMPAMARGLEKFQQLIRSVGGTFELRSAYRPPSYQGHLQAVWFKWMLELRNNREPGCRTLRAQVSEEFARHNLLNTQKPVTLSDHSRGLAFDATVLVPRVTQLKKRRVSLDRLALLAGIERPDILHDPVHFKLAIGRAKRRT
jgi:D-alanyl-D-alanine dipeptidase